MTFAQILPNLAQILTKLAKILFKLAQKIAIKDHSLSLNYTIGVKFSDYIYSFCLAYERKFKHCITQNWHNLKTLHLLYFML